MGKVQDIFRWNPKKKRSAAQKASASKGITNAAKARLGEDDATSDKENWDDEVIGEKERLKQRAEKYEKNFRNERKKVGRITQSLQAVKQKLCNLTTTRDTTKDLLHKTQGQLEATQATVSQLENHSEMLKKKNDSLRVRVFRTSKRTEKSVQRAVEKERQKRNTFSVQEKGVITDTSRAIMRDLVALGVKAKTVNATVDCIAGHLGTTIDGKFTSRSTRRAVIEGGVASNMQIGEEMKHGDGK
jgi:chromosome segregation ATPase